MLQSVTETENRRIFQKLKPDFCGMPSVDSLLADLYNFPYPAGNL
jgi:hypothetical protein